VADGVAAIGGRVNHVDSEGPARFVAVFGGGAGEAASAGFPPALVEGSRMGLYIDGRFPVVFDQFRVHVSNIGYPGLEVKLFFQIF
jgi:hypothetical protein